jgi:vacuolar-type H+-ATPase subunit B/Vma2
VFERQMRVVLEKAAGVKARKQLSIGTLDTESIFTLDTWSKQMDEDIRPVLTSIINDAQSTYAEKSLVRIPMKKEDIMASVDAQMMRIKSINEETAQEISNSIFATLSVLGEEERATTFRSALVTTFTNLLAKKRGQVAEDETRRAWMVGSQI